MTAKDLSVPRLPLFSVLVPLWPPAGEDLGNSEFNSSLVANPLVCFPPIGVPRICCAISIRVSGLGPVSRKSRNFWGDIIIFVSSKRRRLEARNLAVILIFIPYNIWKDQLYRISSSGSKGFRDFREAGLWKVLKWRSVALAIYFALFLIVFKVNYCSAYGFSKNVSCNFSFFLCGFYCKTAPIKSKNTKWKLLRTN